MIKILFVPVGKPTEVREVNESSLEAMQKLVGGYIEPVKLGDDLVAIVNEEGLIKGLPQNRQNGSFARFVGDFFICRLDGAEFASLPDDEITWLKGQLDG